MDQFEAARLLGVADSEIVEVRDVGGRFEVLHHDMASHEENWRPLPEPPFEVRKFGVDVFAEPYSDPGDDEPLVSEPPAAAEKPAPKRRSNR